MIVIITFLIKINACNRIVNTNVFKETFSKHKSFFCSSHNIRKQDVSNLSYLFQHLVSTTWFVILLQSGKILLWKIYEEKCNLLLIPWINSHWVQIYIVTIFCKFDEHVQYVVCPSNSDFYKLSIHWYRLRSLLDSVNYRKPTNQDNTYYRLVYNKDTNYM